MNESIRLPNCVPAACGLRHNKDSAPKQREGTWDQLAKSLGVFRRTPCSPCKGHDCPHKNGPAWSPVEDLPNATRGVKGGSQACASVLYLDKATEETGAQLEKELAGGVGIKRKQTFVKAGSKLVYDLGVLAADDPTLTKDIYSKVNRGEILDTHLAEAHKRFEAAGIYRAGLQPNGKPPSWAPKTLSACGN